jgi:hypothetical protein
MLQLLALLLGGGSAAAGTAATVAAVAGLAGSAVSAAGQIKAGQAAGEESRINAKALEAEKTMNAAVAKQNMNRRIADYQQNMSANIAQFSIGAGRADKSVEAFIKAQKETLGKDIKAIQTQGYLQQQADTVAVSSERARGKAAMTAARIGASTTLLSGVSNYYTTKGG